LETALPGSEEKDYLLIDTSIDLRAQLLREGTPLVTRVAYTHAHVDHFFGLDELRGIQFRTRRPIELYGGAETLASLRRVYTHLFDANVQKGGGILWVETHPVEGRFSVGGFELEPLPVFHGDLPILGYRWGDLAFITDCSAIPGPTWELLGGIDTLVLGMLRKRAHPTHFNLDQALAVVERIAPRRTYFIHMTHDLLHAETNAELPPGVELAYDGLKIDLNRFEPATWERAGAGGPPSLEEEET
jgi:phosphoribosyl 1,2-cyclic phosphate phosphodiesterase